jgi:hypothetical protein
VALIALSPSNVVASPEVGGHFWVYMNWALGLRALGCDVLWLERCDPTGDARRDAARLAAFHERMQRFGLGDAYLLYAAGAPGAGGEGRRVYLNRSREQAEALFRRTELLLNFHYAMDADLLARFRRSALVDIDPGLLQLWLSLGQLRAAPHDFYFTIGETVGTPAARFSDCGLRWTRIRPLVSLDAWPCRSDPAARAFTTVSSWWGGGGKGEWVTDGRDLLYENNKRASFLRFVELPRRVGQRLELALSIGDGSPTGPPHEAPTGWRAEREAPADATDYAGDAHDVALLRRHGWHVRDAREVAGSPEAFQAFVQRSRGEFSCAKPSCMELQNAWISDRTLCYLASGRPAVVQHTGPSAYLPDGLGLFRFHDLEGAVDALASVDAAYEKQSRAAREIAEAYFDARAVLSTLLDAALGGRAATGSA